MPSPLTETRSLEELVAAVRAEGRPVDLDGASRLLGWENVVLRTADGWIYRFPRLGAEAYERELRILAAIHGRLPVQTPRVEWVGQQTPFAAYRALEGAQLDWTTVASLSRSEREPLSRSLAEFLAALHSVFTVDEAVDLRIPASSLAAVAAPARRAADEGSGEDRRALRRLLEAWDSTDLASSANSATLHNDFHPFNMVFTSSSGTLTAIWDFSCVELGDPAADLRYLTRDSMVLSEEIAEHYLDMTGHWMDLRGAWLLGLLERISDAVEESRPLDPVLADWERHPV